MKQRRNMIERRIKRVDIYLDEKKLLYRILIKKGYQFDNKDISHFKNR
jgi:hypothetical protein